MNRDSREVDHYISGSESSQEELLFRELPKKMDEYEDEEDDEESDDDAPTPVNEGMATDDFQWVRGAPIPYRTRPTSMIPLDHEPSSRLRSKKELPTRSDPSVAYRHHHQVTPAVMRAQTDAIQQRHCPPAPLTCRPAHSPLLPSSFSKQLTPVGSVYDQGLYGHSVPCHATVPASLPLPPAPLCCCPNYWYEDVPVPAQTYFNRDSCGSSVCGGVSPSTFAAHHRCLVPRFVNKRHSHHGFQCLDGYHTGGGTTSVGRELLPVPTGACPGSNGANRTAKDKSDSFCGETYHSSLRHRSIRKSLAGGGEYEDLQDKIRMLQTEKENLILQVTVLTEQVEAQGERLRELDVTLEDRKEQLDGTEEMLQQEMLARSSLENSKMDLLTQLAEAKRKLTNVEREKLDLLEKCKKFEAELIIAKSRIVEKDAELATLKARLSRNGTITPVNDSHHHEVEKLKSALESLMISKEEKEKRIEELTLMVSRQKRIHDWLPNDRRASEPSSPDAHGDSIYSPSADSNKSEHRLTEKPPQVPRLSSNLTSTPVSSPSGAGLWSDPRYSPSPSQGSLKSISKANSSENVTPNGTRTPPAKRHYSTIPRQHGVQVLQQIQQQLQSHHRVDSTLSSASAVPLGKNGEEQQVMTTPQQSKSYHNLLNTGNNGTNNSSLPGNASNSSRHGKSSGVSFGKLFFRLRNGKRSCSAPELASEPEIVPVPSDDETSSQILSSTLPPDSALMKMDSKEKNKGFKKIFGKLKRSGSHSMDVKEGEFKRGGVRSTAGPRLGWSTDSNKVEKLDKPFSEWNVDTIVEWMNGMGLSSYTTDCKRWVKNGEHFLKATPHDLEKELGVKNPLHRKKLLLALQAAGGNKQDPKKVKDKTLTETEPDSLQFQKALSKLDHHWVVRWLDDVGLPQYKDSFVDARVDGRVLNVLTVEDLFALKVTNLLHHVSIKRGIQVLRENKFDPFCLKRRSLPDEKKEYSPLAVVLWTNHRVMEWLKTVDLSEYAPNLRGSGVHGALIVFEPRFNAELLASLLNIPPNKTLLRRHLTTQFKSLVGPPLMQEKRDCEILQDGVNNPPLTPNTKVKAVHKGQFTLLRKKSKGETAFEDLVCPLGLTPPKSMTQAEEAQEKKQERTAEEIGAVSKNISSLTNNLKDEKLLAAMETTNV